ncbi:hypothetical protein HU200_026970 [Digitaria exilis]|uniref:Amino acid transporter transmembrane domain-containing protein n=1 Tax=Digitaria exilis TaxID=1010633 RepID=A0A835EV42_9POAL|nr:hypothetical protein HU200_026970 [Digitaria exilis]
MATTTTTATGNADPPPPSPSPASSKTGFLRPASMESMLSQRWLSAGEAVSPWPFSCTSSSSSWPSTSSFSRATTSTSSSRTPGSTSAGLHVSAKQGFVLAATLAVLPTTWFSSLGVLAYVAAGGALASVVLVASVMWVAVFDGVGFHERGRLVHWAGLPAAVSLYSFCFSGHAVFHMIYNGMKDRKKFPMVLFICFLVSTLSYGFMGIIGYLMYGDALMSQEAIVVATTIVALSVPFFADVVALTGALLSCTAPCSCPACASLGSVPRSGSKKLWMETEACVCIVVVGAAIVVLGTYSSVKQIVQRLK